ncbi:uncharacterized protein LOC135491379 [Lineus longissimus]|uniref:uncharacterized protein LOC135491379 n=1 Tax=Lineus longissimus TaxID=88925 RepID=UPI002B4F1330
MGFFYWLYCLIYYCFVDFLCIIVVDLCVKAVLREASDERQKQKIWLYESLVLSMLSVVVFLASHCPYLLLLFTLVTFMYTQLSSHVDLRYWWASMMNRWDEFQQHEQSMEEFSKRLQHVQQQQQMMQQSGSPGMYNLNNRSQRFMANPQVFNPYIHVSPRRPLRQDMSPPYRMATRNAPAEFTNVPGLRYRNFDLNRYTQPCNQVPQQNAWEQNQQIQPPVQVPSGSEVASSEGTNPSDINIHKTSTESLTSRIRSALGIGSYHNVPYGLKNNGENLCFMNSVLQCLSKSPGLGSRLESPSVQSCCSPIVADLVKSFSELLYELSHKRGYKLMSVSDASTFRLAASLVDATVVAPPDTDDSQQNQQDAAEFLMWLLDIVHTGTNAAISGQNGAMIGQSKAAADTEITNPTLATLRFIYGDLTPKRIEDMKHICLKEIETANGLDNSSHAEAMQRLSDLEWLLHKQQNKSVIDDLFTGQLVEAQHCLSCNRVSVGIQTFNILPVPIVEAREVSGVVYLMDCFSKFGNMENLFDSDGLQCPCSNKNPDTPPVFINTPTMNAAPPAKGPTTHVGRLLSRDSAVGSPVASSHPMFSQSTLMSPIPSGTAEVFNDSGFQDNQYKTSTPILHERIRSTEIRPRNLTNGQRRSLLRQLPECLVVQLLRFRYNSAMRDLCKIHTPVNIPLKNLNLNSVVFDSVVKREDLTAPPEGYEYDLYAVCLHLGAGATNCGHYIAYCMVSDGTWWKFDDDEVTQVNMEFELNSRLVRENAYMLFYKRKIVS